MYFWFYYKFIIVRKFLVRDECIFYCLCVCLDIIVGVKCIDGLDFL